MIHTTVRPSHLTGILRSIAIQAGALVVVAAGCGPSAEVRYYNDIGLDRLDDKQYYGAIAAFQVAREHDRETPEPSYYMGLCYLALADQNFNDDNLVTAVRYCDRAIAQFTDAYSAFPGYTKALQGKADALKRKGQYQAAIDLADWAVRACGPRANILIFRAREYASHGDKDRALAILQQATQVEPDSAAAHAELGRFYARYGNRTAAIESLTRALELDPNAPGVAMTLDSLEGRRQTAAAARSPVD